MAIPDARWTKLYYIPYIGSRFVFMGCTVPVHVSVDFFFNMIAGSGMFFTLSTGTGSKATVGYRFEEMRVSCNLGVAGGLQPSK